MAERSPLSNQASYTNVNGDEAVGRRVREERTRLERTYLMEEWRADVLMF